MGWWGGGAGEARVSGGQLESEQLCRGSRRLGTRHAPRHSTARSRATAAERRRLRAMAAARASPGRPLLCFRPTHLGPPAGALRARMSACLLAVITGTEAVAPLAPERAPPAEVAVEFPLPPPVQETQPQERGPVSDAPEMQEPPPLWRKVENVELAVAAGFAWVKCVGYPHWPAQVLPKEAALSWIDRVPCPRGATAEEPLTVCPGSWPCLAGAAGCEPNTRLPGP